MPERRTVGPLTATLCVVETINELAARSAKEFQETGDKGVTPTLVDVINESRNVLSGPQSRESNNIVLSKLSSVGLMDVDRESLSMVIGYLLRSKQRLRQGEQEGTDVMVHEAMADAEATVYRHGDGFCTVPHEREYRVEKKDIVAGEGNVKEWEEEIEPVSVMLGILQSELGYRDRTADHFVQQFIRSSFSLKHGYPLRLILRNIVDKLNTIFFGSFQPTYAVESEAQVTGCSLDVLFSIVYEQCIAIKEIDKEADPTKLALGFYLILRFGRLLRCSYKWWTSNNAVTQPIQWVRLARPAEYSYLLAKTFGALTGLSGLNFIFRGGVVPQVDRGRTALVAGAAGSGKTCLALHVLADMAYRGQIGLYISFEESYQNVVDRLTAFGLRDSRRFEIVQLSENFEEEISAKVLRSTEDKGFLLLYKPEKEKSSMQNVINDIDIALKEDRRWRALVLDSINGMDSAQEADQYDLRSCLGRLIRCIDGTRFLGLLLAEENSNEVRSLEFLTDTIIKLRYDSTNRERSIEITKSRSQLHHVGCHPMSIIDGVGVRIFPGMHALRSTIHKRRIPQISETHEIPLDIERLGEVEGIREGAVTLIQGARSTGKTRLLLDLMTKGNRKVGAVQSRQLNKPTGVLLITFLTSENRILEQIRDASVLRQQWYGIRNTAVRYFAPGDDLAAEQIALEIWDRVTRARQAASPITRVGFDNAEEVERLLPRVASDSLFWPTIIDLLRSESISTFLTTTADSQNLGLLTSQADYVFSLEMEVSSRKETDEERQKKREKERRLKVSVTRVPTLEWYSKELSAELDFDKMERRE